MQLVPTVNVGMNN